MIWAIVGLAVLAAGLAVAVAVQARARAGDKDATMAADKRATAEHDRAETVIRERDLGMERAAKLAAEVADLTSRLTAVEGERDELAAKLAKFVVKAIEDAPLDQGAAIVNEMFSLPLLPKEPK